MSILTPTITGEFLAGAESFGAGRAVGSLWRRIVAVIVDAIIVGVAAFLIGIPFFDALSRGIWGPVVGFFMALPYYAILNSKMGNGQTLGKKWMHLQVVDAEGNPISFGKSLLRYSILAGANACSKLTLPVARTPGIAFTLISASVLVVGGTTVYLILFDRCRRQGVHDLAVGSFVADADMTGPLKLQPT